MKCSDYVAWISLKLDGTLSEGEVRDLETHLAECSRCRAELALQKKLIHSLKQEVPARLPASFTRQVTQRAKGLAGAERRRRLRLADFLPALLPAAAAVLLIVFNRQISAAVSPSMEAIAESAGGPLVSAGDRIAAALSSLATASDGSPLGSESLASILSNTYVGLTIACAAITWAFTKAYTFLRE
jgi:anti-sigma factor RsiW